MNMWSFFWQIFQDVLLVKNVHMYLDNLSLYESKSRTFVLFESVVWNVSDFFSILFFQVSKQFVGITSIDPHPPQNINF